MTEKTKGTIKNLKKIEDVAATILTEAKHIREYVESHDKYNLFDGMLLLKAQLRDAQKHLHNLYKIQDIADVDY